MLAGDIDSSTSPLLIVVSALPAVPVLTREALEPNRALKTFERIRSGYTCMDFCYYSVYAVPVCFLRILPLVQLVA